MSPSLYSLQASCTLVHVNGLLFICWREDSDEVLLYLAPPGVRRQPCAKNLQRFMFSMSKGHQRAAQKSDVELLG